jgi:hypothetical protein
VTTIVVALITALVTVIGFLIKDRYSLLKPLRDEIMAMREDLNKAIDHVAELRTYIHDNIPNADPPRTPSWLRK